MDLLGGADACLDAQALLQFCEARVEPSV